MPHRLWAQGNAKCTRFETVGCSWIVFGNLLLAFRNCLARHWLLSTRFCCFLLRFGGRWIKNQLFLNRSWLFVARIWDSSHWILAVGESFSAIFRLVSEVFLFNIGCYRIAVASCCSTLEVVLLSIRCSWNVLGWRIITVASFVIWYRLFVDFCWLLAFLFWSASTLYRLLLIFFSSLGCFLEILLLILS